MVKIAFEASFSYFFSLRVLRACNVCVSGDGAERRESQVRNGAENLRSVNRRLRRSQQMLQEECVELFQLSLVKQAEKWKQKVRQALRSIGNIGYFVTGSYVRVSAWTFILSCHLGARQ